MIFASSPARSCTNSAASDASIRVMSPVTLIMTWEAPAIVVSRSGLATACLTASRALYKLPAFSGFTREDFEKIVVRGCYPLSPITAYLLLNISEKVAQNERTLFTFISKEEQYSVARTVKTMSDSKNWIIDADLVYDYFKSLFKKDVTNEFIHGE